MSKSIGESITILNANAADVAAANSTWYSVERADEVMLDIQITGTANCTIEQDLHNGNTATFNNTYNSSNQVVLDDPMGQIRASSNNVGVGEAVVVKMRKVFFNRR